jgi:hypothetical protein
MPEEPVLSHRETRDRFNLHITEDREENKPGGGLM